MGEMADYYREQREKKQAKAAANYKWNTDVIYALYEELGFEIKKHSESHFSLIHKIKGRMDYWPSTGKAVWVKKNKFFVIKDIEDFLLKNFK